MKYQEFSIFYDDIPGFNQMINAAKSFGHRSKTKLYNSYTAMKKTWVNRLCVAIEEKSILPVDKVFVYLLWFEKNKKRDPDNIASFIKFIFDALQKAKIVKNDGWNEIIGWENKFEVSNKRGVRVRLLDADTYEDRKNQKEISK